MKSSFNLKHFYYSFCRSLESSPTRLDVYDTERLNVENKCNNEEFSKFDKLYELSKASYRCHQVYDKEIVIKQSMWMLR